VQMLRNFLEPKLNERGNPAVWFQKDGATARTARRSMGVLWEMFPGRLISLRCDIRGQHVYPIPPLATPFSGGTWRLKSTNVGRGQQTNWKLLSSTKSRQYHRKWRDE
jgi:hypothetical protein